MPCPLPCFLGSWLLGGAGIAQAPSTRHMAPSRAGCAKLCPTDALGDLFHRTGSSTARVICLDLHAGLRGSAPTGSVRGRQPDTHTLLSHTAREEQEEQEQQQLALPSCPLVDPASEPCRALSPAQPWPQPSTQARRPVHRSDAGIWLSSPSFPCRWEPGANRGFSSGGAVAWPVCAGRARQLAATRCPGHVCVHPRGRSAGVRPRAPANRRAVRRALPRSVALCGPLWPSLAFSGPL